MEPAYHVPTETSAHSRGGGGGGGEVQVRRGCGGGGGDTLPSGVWRSPRSYMYVFSIKNLVTRWDSFNKNPVISRLSHPGVEYPCSVENLEYRTKSGLLDGNSLISCLPYSCLGRLFHISFWMMQCSRPASLWPDRTPCLHVCGA